MSAPTLTLGRLRLHCRVAASPERVEGAAARIREGLDALLADAAGPWLPRDVGDGGDDVLFIERLEIPVQLDAAWDRDRIARAFARAFARALGAEMERRDAGEGRLYFHDRADLLARFFGDVATGAPWPRHWQREFAGLTMLPPSAAILTVLLQEVTAGLDALSRLTAAAAARVIAALTPDDAARVVEALHAMPAGDAGEAMRLVWRVARAEGLDAAWAGDPCAVLRLCVTARRESSAVPAGAIVQAIHAIGSLQAALGRLDVDGEGLDSGVRALRADALRDLLDGGPGAEVGDPEWLAGVVTVLRGVARPAGASRSPAWKERRSTPFGGAFLLLATLERLGLHGLESLPAAEGTSAHDLVALVAIARALGPDVAAQAFDDPVLRDVLSIAPGLREDGLTAWQQTLGGAGARVIRRAFDPSGGCSPRAVLPEFAGLPVGHRAVDAALGIVAHRLLRRFALLLHGFAASGPGHLRANFLALPASAEREVDRWVVRLGRPPLDLILRMAGMKRRELTWGAVRMALFDEE